MKLVGNGCSWEIEGPGKERARVAYATEKEGRLALSVKPFLEEVSPSMRNCGDKLLTNPLMTGEHQWSLDR